MADINLQEIHDLLVSIAFEAGKMIMAANPSTISTDTKLNSADIVTETDQAVERMVGTKLRAAYPQFEFVGEETYVAGQTKVTDAPTFIVDPIDGTTNFVHGFPAACTSLGFAVGRKAVVGVVYNPFLDILYTGIKGKGSYMHVRASMSEATQKYKLPLAGKGDGSRAPPLRGLQNSLVAVEWGSTREGNNYKVKLDTFRKLASSKESGGAMVHSLRSLGSAAINLCQTATGELDMYWEGGCYAWDVCAGWCILEEAGGIMVSGNPGAWETQLDSRVYFAIRGAPSGQKETVEEFWAVVGDGRLEYKH